MYTPSAPLGRMLVLLFHNISVIRHSSLLKFVYSLIIDILFDTVLLKHSFFVYSVIFKYSVYDYICVLYVCHISSTNIVQLM